MLDPDAIASAMGTVENQKKACYYYFFLNISIHDIYNHMWIKVL